MATKNDNVHFIMTGGTIDSHYEGSKDTVIPNKKSFIPSFIKSLKLHSKTRFTEVCMKDSRDLTKNDLKRVLKAIEKSTCKKIIITHGTYTMPDTARYLKAHLSNNDKIVVLTGSMIPTMGFTPSDAPFNLGFAVAKVQDLNSGVYVCMNGKVFSSEEVTKIVAEGRFVSILG